MGLMTDKMNEGIEATLHEEERRISAGEKPRSSSELFKEAWSRGTDYAEGAGATWKSEKREQMEGMAGKDREGMIEQFKEEIHDFKMRHDWDGLMRERELEEDKNLVKQGIYTSGQMRNLQRQRARFRKSEAKRLREEQEAGSLPREQLPPLRSNRGQGGYFRHRREHARNARRGRRKR